MLFKVMSEAVDTALEGLKEHRRYLKLASRSDTKGTVRSGLLASAQTTIHDQELLLYPNHILPAIGLAI